MKSKAAVFAALMLAAPLAAAPGDMSIATFLTKADALKKKGIMALGSSDYKKLKGEVDAASVSYRSRLKSDKAAGKPAHSCPPAKASMNSDQLLAHFRSYPVSQRSSTSVRTGFFDLMKKRYPC
jgi:hypothetical protein